MFHTKIFQVFKCLIQEAEILFVGFCFLAIIPPLVVLSSIPVYIYRCILSLITKCFCTRSIDELVPAKTNLYTTEFLPWHSPKSASRSTIVATFKLEGFLPFERISELIQTKWLGTTTNYPELQQYIQLYMGFFFWKWDKNFRLENHLKPYNFKATTEEGFEEESREFVEKLLNKPFSPKRSPWEWFVVYDKITNQTVFIFRYHHALADGFSSMNALIAGLGGTPLALPSTDNQSQSLLNWNKFLFFLTFPFRLWFEFSHMLALLSASDTPWHVPDKKKAWKQLYKRSKPIPIQAIKDIKNRLSVTFTAVIMSCLSAAISKNVLKKRKTGLWRKSLPESVAIMTILPHKHEPNKLGNNLSGAVLQLPTKVDLNPLERLMKIEKLLKNARTSALSAVYNFAMKIVGSHFAPVTALFTKNRYFPLGFTNFPGPSVEVEIGGKKALSADFAVGGQVGIAGLNFMVMSFKGYIRIAVVAEKAAMDRNELDALVEAITDEIEEFNKISNETIKISRGNNNI